MFDADTSEGRQLSKRLRSERIQLVKNCPDRDAAGEPIASSAERYLVVERWRTDRLVYRVISEKDTQDLWDSRADPTPVIITIVGVSFVGYLVALGTGPDIEEYIFPYKLLAFFACALFMTVAVGLVYRFATRRRWRRILHAAQEIQPAPATVVYSDRAWSIWNEIDVAENKEAETLEWMKFRLELISTSLLLCVLLGGSVAIYFGYLTSAGGEKLLRATEIVERVLKSIF